VRHSDALFETAASPAPTYKVMMVNMVRHRVTGDRLVVRRRLPARQRGTGTSALRLERHTVTRVAIAGATGYMGGRLARRLL